MRMTRSMTRAKADGERKRKRESGDTTDQEHLLPKIPDDITLQVICGKLPWSTFGSLSFVSPTWHRAFRTGRIHEGRAASHSAEMFVVVNHTLSDGFFGLSLYSLGDNPKRRETLPPIPRMRSGIPQSCECIILDGKLYILGGLRDHRTQLSSANVYMLNLQGGCRRWRKCASMLSPRQKFRAGIINGKIYVCGGSSRRAPVRGTEVYDPEADAWTALQPMPWARIDHDAEIVDGKMFVYGGAFFYENFREFQADFRRSVPRALNALFETTDIPEECYTYDANHLDVYDHVLDEWVQVLLEDPEKWRLESGELSAGVQEDWAGSEGWVYSEASFDSNMNYERRYEDRMFMSEGSLFSVTFSRILVFNFLRLAWRGFRSISRETREGRDSPRIDTATIMAVEVLDDHLLIIGAPWDDQDAPEQLYFATLHLEPSEQPAEEIRVNWTIVDNGLSFDGLVSPFIRVLSL